MTDTAAEETKRDQNFWYPHIENCKRAGISGAKYCREHDLVCSQFLYWRDKYNKNQSDFIGVKVSRRNVAECLCSLEFPRGQKLMIHNIECLRMLPKLLELTK